MTKLNRKKIEDILALTPLQEGMLFHYQKEPKSNLYFEQLSLEISGEIEAELFEKAWNVVIETNETLRAVFRWEKLEKPTQIILKENKCNFAYYDLSSKDGKSRNAALEEIKNNDRNNIFDLRHVPFRVILCKKEEREYEVIISNHHILYDGWSNGILLKNFFNAYHKLCTGKRSTKSPVKSSYKDFVKWIYDQDKNKQDRFWGDYLDGLEAATDLPIKRKKTGEARDAVNYPVLFERGINEGLDIFVKNNRVTLASVFYSAWGILLQKYWNREDVIFGTTVSGRAAKIKGIEEMVGLFINTIPLRVQTFPAEKIVDVINRVDNVLPKREEFENTPLVEIAESGALNGAESLFDTIVVIENYPIDSRLIPGGSSLSIRGYSIVETTHYDLTIGITLSEKIEVGISYNRALFDETAIKNLAMHFKGIVLKIVETPDVEVSRLEIISTEEKNHQLYNFNKTEVEFPGDKTIHGLFEEQVEQTPDHIAVVFLSAQITYRKLNEQSDRTALLLNEKGVLPGAIVGIMLERSIEMIVGILGILKAGAAYLPIEPDYPQERIEFMLKDSGAKIILMNSDVVDRSACPSQPLNFSTSQLLISVAGGIPLTRNTNTCYVIYTSGSTGKPKGVMVEHRSVVNILFALQNEYPFGSSDTYLLKTSYIFDVSVAELFGWFMGGGRMAILEREGHKAPHVIVNAIEENRISHINFVPSMFNVFIEYLAKENKTRISSLKYIFLAGEALLPQTVKKFTGFGLGVLLENIYGPTEGTVYTSKYSLSGWSGEGSIPIGKPLANVTLYILNKGGGLQPVGVPGELCISGVGLARGYLNRPEMTAERFTNTFYKTGDLARWLIDGNIEYLGRMDRQVKIRGFRIELGEIENRLVKHELIKEAAVVVKEDKSGDKCLAAYIVSSQELSIPGIREYLAKELPDYMIPSYIVRLENAPLTATGKLDRRALPEPGMEVKEEYTAPRNLLEEKLVEIWKDVLRIEGPIGIDDNFFHMGGHSLKATGLVYRVYKEMNVEIEIKDIFTQPTIRKLVQCIKERKGIEYIEIEAVEEKEYYELSYAQRRLWVLCQFEKDSTAYNMPTAFIFSGAFDLEIFRQAVQTLANRHESLRTVFLRVNGEPKQKIIHHFVFTLESFDLRGLDEKEKEEQTRRLYLEISNKAFDLETGPLFRLVPIRVEDEKYILAYNMHHIINDGWSQGVMYNELTTLYNVYIQGNKNPFLPLELQYKDYSRWHNRLVEEGHFETCGKYWLEKFKDKPNGIDLPFDHPRKPVQTFNGDRVDFVIDKERTTRLQQLTLTEDVTFFMSLLTLINIFLYKYTGQNDIIIGSPIANRKKPELHPMVGFLVNTLVYRNTVDPTRSYKQSLEPVKKEALNCYEHQDFPFDLLVEKLELDRDLSQSPLFNAIFAHNNTETANLALTMEGVAVTDYPYSGDFNMSKFDFTIFMDEMDYGVQTRFEYNSDLFDRSTIERMSVNFLVLVDLVIENADIPISMLNILSGKEYETVTRSFNDTRCDFPRITLQELFEAQTEKLKDKIAAIDHEDTITYNDLNKKANRVAHYLRRIYGIKPNEVIAISMDRSIEMIVVILGVLKSGAAYLAVDPTYPRDRVLHILQDSRSKLLIIDKNRPELFGDYSGEILHIFSRMDAIDKEMCDNPGITNQPSDILYVNYTSGSTGTPNGAMLSHDCLTNLIRWQNEKTGIDCSLRCLQFTSINFCVSFQEIMGTLTSGGELHLIGDIERQDIDYLMNFLSGHQIEILFLPFSYLNFLFNESGRWDRTFKSNLKHIVTAGEQLKITTGLKRFLNSNPHLQLHNHYGSTEMHVVTSYTLDASTAEKTPIPPAGKPISNIAIYIVDDYFNPAPIGAYGELCVAGSTEILGYIHNNELTEKKLVECPVLSGMKLYRSGDIGRWLPDGNIELRGRKDFLVKVRGFRVELGEIESKILSIENVRECVVVAKEDEKGQKYLVAYVSVDEIDGKEIKRIIGAVLPQYMLPKIIIMESLPLMPNGKVDREKLPEPKEPGKRITYEELKGISDRLADRLKEKGVKPGASAGILGLTPFKMAASALAISKIGGTSVLIPSGVSQDEVEVKLKGNRVSLVLMQGQDVENYSYAALQGLSSGNLKWISAPTRPPIGELDKIPLPDRSLVDYEKYSRFIGITMVKDCITILSSRGCPYNCAYCHRIWPKKQVYRSAENIFKEVKLYYDMGVRRFAFIDDIFNLQIENSSRFFQFILNHKMDVQFFFSGGLRGDILTPGFIDLMVEAGTVGISAALETASPRLQKFIGKNLNVDRLRENLEYISKKYPQVILELHTMHGFPTETEEEAHLTLDFIKNLKWLDFPYIHMVRIYPNTEMERLALAYGVSKEAIIKSRDMAYHEWAETSPFKKSFTQGYQAEFFNDYFLNKERLLHVLPREMKSLTETDMAQKYNSYLPVEIGGLEDLLSFLGVRREELSVKECIADGTMRVPGLNRKIGEYFHNEAPEKEAFRILLLDLSQYFSADGMLFDVVEAPLGLISILTYLNRGLGVKINGKIAKARADFNNYSQLISLLEDFNPQIIGIRTLTFYKDFFHRTVESIRQHGFNAPIIAGGPYASSDYNIILQDTNIDLAVVGEGEITFLELVEKIIENDGKLPGEEILKEIPGLVFVPFEEKSATSPIRKVLELDNIIDDWKEEKVSLFSLFEEKNTVDSLSRDFHVTPVTLAQIRGVLEKENIALSGVDEVLKAPSGEIESKLAKIWSELLGIEEKQLGSDDNFFELGGHSLKAITMMSNIHKELNVKVELVEIFQNPTIHDIAQFIHGLKTDIFQSLEPVEEKDYYSLSSSQKRLYILQQIVEGNTAYNMPGVMELKGEVNITKFEDTFCRLVERHESFRTSFHIVEGEPVQRIENRVEFKIEYFELTEVLGSVGTLFQKGSDPSETLIKTFIRPFDLSQAPLLRVGLIKIKDETHLLMVDMSHIVSDGTSIGVLVREFMILYGGGELPALRVQYKDYSEWRKSETQLEAIKEQEAYWLRQYEGEPPVLALPMDYLRPPVQRFEGGVVNFEVTPVETGELKALALKANATLYMVSISIYIILLSRLSGQEDIVIGTPVAGRNHADLQNVIGMFVNTLALRNYPLGEKRFIEFLGDVRTRTLESFSNQDYSYEDLVEKTQAPRDAGRNPLFDVFFTLQNVDIPEAEIPGLKISPYDYERKLSKFDLILSGSEAREKLLFEFEYCATLFREETILRFASYFKRIIAAVVENSEVKLSEIEIIGGEEKQRILNEFNKTGEDYPKDKTIHELYGEQVERTPDHISVVFLSTQISYRELNEKSDFIARRLGEEGVQPGDIVGLKLEKSIEMIVGMLGILKTGAAYMPINPKNPQERTDFMLKDSNAKMIIDKSFLTHFFTKKWAAGGISLTLNTITNTCYVIYTSGSTGNPKGVPVTHANFMPLLHWGYKNLGIGEGDRALQNLSYHFDWSVWEIFITLTTGAGLYIAAEEILLDPVATADFINKNGITVLHITPTQYGSFIRSDCRLETLKYLFIGAEKLSVELAERSFESVGERCRVFNMYGPTEATIISAVLELERGEIERYRELSGVPIGSAVGNSKLMILDKRFNLCPILVAGELFIGGDGVAWGYLNNPELTAERFINQGLFLKKPPLDPTKTFVNGLTLNTNTLYKTGDLARWLSDGNIEYLGRTDYQVKVRGFRIELGEIESRLLAYKSIKEAVAIIRERQSEGEFKDNYLCAYLVSDEAVDISGLKTYLSGTLPEYMIPSHIAQIEKIPLTLSGKVDRKSLPESGIISQDIYIAPRNEMEEKLVGVWAGILGIGNEQIGMNSNFFDLGGNSIKIIELSNKLKKTYNIDIPVVKLFRYTTIGAQSEYLNQDRNDETFLNKNLIDADKLGEIKDSLQGALELF